jgi:hypothetical protein
MTALDRARRALLLAASLALLAACSGGGDDDEDEPEPPEDADATGVWSGTYAGTPGRMNVIVAPDGSFAGIINPLNPPGSNARLIVGTGTTTQNAINATGTAYALQGVAFPNGSFVVPLTVSAGSVTERTSLTGNFSAGGETATFSLSFLPASTRTPSFATLAGVYSLYPPPPNGTLQATMTVRTDGSVTFNHSNGCVGSGTFTIIDPAWNIYRWSLAITSCASPVADHSASGLAALVDAAGGTSNLLTMTGTATGAPLPWWFFNGTK